MSIAKEPTLEDRIAAREAGRPSPEAGANVLKMMFVRDLQASLVAANRIRTLVKNYGLESLQVALGADGDALVPAYSALKTYIQALDPSLSIPDLE